jgi:hypothetical protein
MDSQRRGGEAAAAGEFGEREHPCIEPDSNGDDATMAFDEPIGVVTAKIMARANREAEAEAGAIAELAAAPAGNCGQ